MQPQKSKAHKTIEDRYEAIRVKARTAASASLPLVISNGEGQGINVRGEVTLGGLDFRALVQAKAWESSPLR